MRQHPETVTTAPALLLSGCPPVLILPPAPPPCAGPKPGPQAAPASLLCLGLAGRPAHKATVWEPAPGLPASATTRSGAGRFGLRPESPG